MNLSDIFNNQYGNLRSGWRFLLFLLSFIFLSGLVNSVVRIIFSNFGIEYGFGSLSSVAVSSSVSLVIAVLLGWLFGKHLEDLPFRALGAWITKNWLKDLTFGLILGAATLMFAVLIGVSFGGLSFSINESQDNSAIAKTLAFSLIVFILGAAFEEALFRGYILQTFARARLAWLAILLTSLFFAVGHLGNANANYLSTINTILAGVWFSAAYLKTRTLWLPFGLHLMWNWFQGAIFGIEVSGITSLTAAPLLRELDSGPGWLTGENYGVEGGVACTVALIFSSVLIWFLPLFKPTAEMLALTDEETVSV